MSAKNANEKDKTNSGIYSIQEHDATHLHWDLRLEKDGVLKSWALPKQPTNDVGVRRLAIQTEDHELSFAFFEGKLPEGSYGAGTIKVYDRGICRFIDYKEREKYIVDIKGQKLNGIFVLLKFKKDKEWLFFRKG